MSKKYAKLENLERFLINLRSLLEGKAPIIHSHNLATNDTPGYMSPEEKIKLDSIAIEDIFSGVLEAGNTSLVFHNSKITQTSRLEVFTNVFGVTPNNIEFSDGVLTMTFDAQEVDVEVRVVITVDNKLSENVLFGTLSANESTLIIEDASILATSQVDFFTSVYGVEQQNSVVENGKITLTYVPHNEDVTIMVIVRNIV